MFCRAAIAASVLTCSAIAQTTPPAAALAAPVATKSGPHPLGLDDLDHLLGVGSPQVSPDGKWVLYTVGRVDTTADKRITDLWMVSWDGTQNIRLTYTASTARSARRAGAPMANTSRSWLEPPRRSQGQG
jgi:hypothetical protein